MNSIQIAADKTVPVDAKNKGKRVAEDFPDNRIAKVNKRSNEDFTSQKNSNSPTIQSRKICIVNGDFKMTLNAEKLILKSDYIKSFFEFSENEEFPFSNLSDRIKDNSALAIEILDSISRNGCFRFPNNMDEAVSIYHIAKYFQIDDLTLTSVSFIISQIKIENFEEISKVIGGFREINEKIFKSIFFQLVKENLFLIDKKFLDEKINNVIALLRDYGKDVREIYQEIDYENHDKTMVVLFKLLEFCTNIEELTLETSFSEDGDWDNADPKIEIDVIDAIIEKLEENNLASLKNIHCIAWKTKVEISDNPDLKKAGITIKFT